MSRHFFPALLSVWFHWRVDAGQHAFTTTSYRRYKLTGLVWPINNILLHMALNVLLTYLLTYLRNKTRQPRYTCCTELWVLIIAVLAVHVRVTHVAQVHPGTPRYSFWYISLLHLGTVHGTLTSVTHVA